MPYALILAILLSAAAAFGAVRQRTRSTTMNLLGRGVTLADLETLSEGQVLALLDRLESEEAPEPVMGAMCYAVAQYPEVADYICPVCGEKTEYTSSETQFIEWELQGCRRLFDSISGATEFNLELDETRFCGFCSQAESETPALYLVLTREDGTVVSNQVSQHDLMILESFLRGRLYYMTWNDGQEPLKPYADRIRTLLGIENDISAE
jgi:hypothetical protein